MIWYSADLIHRKKYLTPYSIPGKPNITELNLIMMNMNAKFRNNEYSKCAMKSYFSTLATNIV